jgi:hypothetical protein
MSIRGHKVQLQTNPGRNISAMLGLLLMVVEGRTGRGGPPSFGNSEVLQSHPTKMADGNL